MRGRETKQSSMVCLMSPEERVPADHPLRRIKKTTDAVLKRLSPLFDEMYAGGGSSSVPPERLLKAMLFLDSHVPNAARVWRAEGRARRASDRTAARRQTLVRRNRSKHRFA
jgi:hypothetical protein